MQALRRLLSRRFHDIRLSCMTLPGADIWRRCLLYYLIYVGCGVPIGFISGLLRFEPLRVAPGALVILIAYLFISPALVEELIFRGFLLPRNWCGMKPGRLLALCGASLSLFITSHVINGRLFHRPPVDVFTNPWFLLEAAMLGAMCTAAYLTSGSVWPGVVAHWLTVVVWIVLLGGHNLLQLHQSAAR